jgi:hypothetical protein
MSDDPRPARYYCRKGFFAMNLQAVCDADRRFLAGLWTRHNKVHTEAPCCLSISEPSACMAESQLVLSQPVLPLSTSN